MTALSIKERSQRRRDKKKGEGLAKMEVHVYPEDKHLIKAVESASQARESIELTIKARV